MNDYNEFEQEMEVLRQEISKLIKNHLISRYTEEYLQAKLPHFSSIDDNVEMLTQTILITFGKFALEHGWFKTEEENND